LQVAFRIGLKTQLNPFEWTRHFCSNPDHLFFCFVDAGSGSGNDGEYFQLISN